MAERIAERRYVEAASAEHSDVELTRDADRGLLGRRSFAVVWRAASARHPPGVRIR
jgi:hypothetical protein